MKVVKANGEVEPFDESKIRRSLQRAGADAAITDKVIEEVRKKAHDGITTKALYKIVFRTLKSFRQSVAGKYNLKRAIMELGPTGFPFEKFIAEIMEAEGYRTQTSQIVMGRCVKHEVDVIAELDDTINMFECKYYTTTGKYCDVKNALYVHARFLDIGSNKHFKNKKFSGWLVTNTRFTKDAEQYGTCVGLEMMSWDFPANKSLRDIIDKHNLHPITCLTSLTKKEKQFLLNENIVLARNLCQSPDTLEKIPLTIQKAAAVMEEARALCEIKTTSVK